MQSALNDVRRVTRRTGADPGLTDDTEEDPLDGIYVGETHDEVAQSVRSYVDYAAVENDERVAATDPTLAPALAAIREILNAIDDLTIEIEALQEGPGLVHAYMKANNDAEIERFLSRLTASGFGRNPVSAPYLALWTELLEVMKAHRVAAEAQPPYIEDFAAEDDADDVPFAEQLKSLEGEYLKLIGQLRFLSVDAAAEVGAFLFRRYVEEGGAA